MKKAPFIIIAIIALVALALIVDLTPSGDSAKAELLKISLFDGAAIRFHASRETVIAEFGQPDSVEVVGAEKLCYHDLPFCGDRAEVVFAIDQRTDQMITFNARIPCETEEEADDLLPRIKERVKAQYPVIRRYFKTLEYANPTDNFYFENQFAYYFSVDKMVENDDAKKPAHICVKKTSTLQILTSKTLSEEEYQAIDQVFSDLFEHTPVIRCRPASSGFSFMVDEYYGRLEWFSELLYYPEELDHDKIGTIVTGHHSTSCALEPHWEAHIYYIN